MLNLKLIMVLLVGFIFIVPNGYAGFGSVNRATSQAISKQLSNRMIRPQLRIKNSSGRILKMAADKKFQAFLLLDESIRVWDLEIGVQRPGIARTSSKFTSISLDSENEQILVGYDNGAIGAMDILTAKPVFSLKTNNESSVVDMTITENGLLIASFRDGATVSWDLKTKKEIWRVSLDGAAEKLSFNNRYWAGVINEKNIEIRTLEDGKLIRDLSPISQKVVFLKVNESQDKVKIGYSTGEAISLNIMSGEKLGQKKIGDELTVLESDSQNHYAVYLPETGKLLVLDEDKGSEVEMDIGEKEVDLVSFTYRKNQLFVTDKEGGVYLFDIFTGKKLLQLVSTRQGWTVLDGVGRFDTSESGLPNVSWDADGHEIPLDKFSEKYYEPGLLAKVLSGRNEYINKKPLVVEEGIYLPPKLVLNFEDDKVQPGKPARLSVDVFDQGGEIDQIRVFHNGKALSLDNAVIKEQDKKGKRLEMEIDPVQGKNLLEVVAIDKRGVESESVDLIFQAKGLLDTTLRVVTIGVNQYADPRLDLDYSVADAESVARLLRENKLVHFNKVEDRLIYNKNATRSEILRSIREAGQHSQNDVLAIYMAGHGIVVDSEWYFLPHETILQPNAAYYATVGISANQIKDLLIKSRAQKILLMVDSCYSGAGVSAFNTLINTQRHMSRSLSRSVGIIVLTAARKNQEAAELSDLGHGLFTYVVTKGMDGNADIMPKNNKISAYEIVDFTKKEIPLLTRKYAGASQDPVAFQMGKDFDLLSK